MNDDMTDELAPRAEIFRSKLIEDFQLIDMIVNSGGAEPPKYYSNEITDDEVMKQLLRETPQGLIKFQVYSKKDEQRFTDRRLNRVKNKNAIPLGPWAHTVIEDPRIQNLMMILIITNSIVLGVQAEISKIEDSSLHGLKLVLQIFDFCTLTIFVLEIILKWIDGFWTFWKNGWNIFDFIVTVMVSRFAQLRIIVLTILKAFKSMAFILILLMTFMYIFAVAGTVMFASYSKSDRTDLKYKQSFSTLGNALVTLFQLFTLDHWYDILRDLVKVVDPITVKIYIILWICIGAFIFRNIFAGIMVMNFQSIRSDFNQQVKEQTEAIEAEQMRNHLVEELGRQDRVQSRIRRISSVGKELGKQLESMSVLAETEEDEEESCETRDNEGIRDSSTPPQGGETMPKPASNEPDPLPTLGDKLAQLREKKNSWGQQSGADQHSIPESHEEFAHDKARDMTNDWIATVQANLTDLKNHPVEILWQRDTLFRYFQLMEAWQENLAERQQLIPMAGQALLKLHDT
ncbi:cation channel sperm-associated protein 2-like isoform X2 [Stylophora pistillata]|uniref:cation channel sperm-associated protein 2-like isoform X2 n=1 Tax=Stylophora pistillata TaxID=50429 RepID=UPI000C047C6B|nr:cation channel sperm-associated protein 2-like isoform X2 [Stylophora pistillata]